MDWLSGVRLPVAMFILIVDVFGFEMLIREGYLFDVSFSLPRHSLACPSLPFLPRPFP